MGIGFAGAPIKAAASRRGKGTVSLKLFMKHEPTLRPLLKKSRKLKAREGRRLGQVTAQVPGLLPEDVQD